MDKYTVGANAGIVWRLLDDNRRMEYREVKKCTGMSDRDLNAAIGWLFCENKKHRRDHDETIKKDFIKQFFSRSGLRNRIYLVCAVRIAFFWYPHPAGRKCSNTGIYEK